MGTHLIVAVTKDKSVGKGPGRPVFSQEEREAVLRSLRIVTGTLLVDNPIEALDQLRPDIWVLGAEYENSVHPTHADFCQQHGIEIAFTRGATYSSTQLLKAKLRGFANEYLQPM